MTSRFMQQVEEANALRAQLAAALSALDEAEAFARRIYGYIQRGAGCCGDAIGRGGRVEQVAEEIRAIKRRVVGDDPPQRAWEFERLTSERDAALSALRVAKEGLVYWRPIHRADMPCDCYGCRAIAAIDAVFSAAAKAP